MDFAQIPNIVWILSAMLLLGYIAFNIVQSVISNRSINGIRHEIDRNAKLSKHNQDDIKQDIDMLKSEMNDVKSEVTEVKSEVTEVKKNQQNNILSHLIDVNEVEGSEAGLNYDTTREHALSNYFYEQAQKLSDLYNTFKVYVQTNRNTVILYDNAIKFAAIPDARKALSECYSFVANNVMYSFPDFFVESVNRILMSNYQKFIAYMRSTIPNKTNLTGDDINDILRIIKKKTIEVHARGVRLIALEYINNKARIDEYENNLKNNLKQSPDNSASQKLYADDINMINRTVSHSELKKLLNENRLNELHQILTLIVPKHLDKVLIAAKARFDSYLTEKHTGTGTVKTELSQIIQSYTYIIENL